MLKNKKLVAAASLLSVLALTPIGVLADDVQNGKIEIQLDTTAGGGTGGGDLTLESVIDLSAKFDIDGNSNQNDISLEESGTIQITDTRNEAVTNPDGWLLKVSIAQPKERGTKVNLGATNIKFGITESENYLTGGVSTSVLDVTTTVLTSTKNLNYTVTASNVAASFSLTNALSATTKGVYESTVVYTLTPRVV